SYHSPIQSISDSPGRNYYDNVTNICTTREFDFSGIKSATMYFWGSIDLEDSFDYFYIEATADSGATWTELASYTGSHSEWQRYSLDIGALALQSSVKFRFRVVSDESVNAKGVDIDDITIAGYAKDYSPPLISYHGPENLIIGTSDYSFDVIVTDVSNISELKVVYTVDDGILQTSYSSIGTGASGVYSMTIPSVTAGSKVKYKVVAVDSTTYLNTSESDIFEIYFGTYLNYENGDQFVDFFDIIGNTQDATAYAIAKRITIGPSASKGHYKADMVGIIIGNYYSTENPNAPMNIHVWSDAGGFPGENIITPFLKEQTATIDNPNIFTMIDLRPYSAELSGLEGDIFVGFTSAGIGSNILYEVASNHVDDPNYIKYKRSWIGSGSGTNISWLLDENDVYHISAIIGEYTLMDIPLAPLNLNGRGGEGNIILNWFEGVDDDIDYYNVYRGDSLEFTIITPIGNVPFSEGASYVDIAPVGGDVDGSFYYKVTAVDIDGNESDISNEIKINPTGIEENIPLTTELFQNYPNPFNPETEINFTLSLTGNVKLFVYNSKGEIVSKLIDENIKKGFHSVKFNGSGSTSGVYYYRFTTDNKTFVRKMILLK
ncbi:MAG: T9SS type A sorting domain-containing protein, partial [Candidatus Cloacimonetes bacterium]|nr:T9SS type A sorting domain-containing protein [Candidatus Cloacimonadota bacterium]